jgi:type III restriction enzyme
MRDDAGKVIGLSNGQKLMLDAGVSKLRILEEQFSAFTQHDNAIKYPKMLVMCEDTTVSPLVVDYLTTFQGLSQEDVIQIDSNKKGEVSDKDWAILKEQLFNIDRAAAPKVIVSVLMLREGFDVNNICVIVPLRSSDAPILLEQTIGRGLRLMWRGADYAEIKRENRECLLDKKEAPKNYLDILSIIEHPKFLDFYHDLFKDNAAGSDAGLSPKDRQSVLGDLIEVSLKENYKDYDLYFPRITREREELLTESEIDWHSLNSFTRYSLDKLKDFAGRDETFVSQEMTVKTQFGAYTVHANLFNADSYNDFLSRIVATLASQGERGKRNANLIPFMQINPALLAATLDNYIRRRLFDEDFDPFDGDAWRVLVLQNTGLVDHIITELSKAVYTMQEARNVIDAQVEKTWFSSIATMKVRENFCIPVKKSIYDQLPYPSNKGQFEKDFIQFLDDDSDVKRFVKIKENYHGFASINYLRHDGILSRYFPDFLVQIEQGDTSPDYYLIETKAEKDTDNANVIAKKTSAVDWCARMNQASETISSEEAPEPRWHYCLVPDSLFYSWKANHANCKDILTFAEITRNDTRQQGELW